MQGALCTVSVFFYFTFYLCVMTKAVKRSLLHFTYMGGAYGPEHDVVPNSQQFTSKK